MKYESVVKNLERIEEKLDSVLEGKMLTEEDIRKIIKGELRSVLLNQYEIERSKISFKGDNPLRLEKYGFKVFSQNDEDGIIEEIFNRIGEESKYFVEFGIQNGLESNCHFLLHKGWKGLWLEGNSADVEKCKKYFAKPISDGRLKVINAFINKDNIDELITNNIDNKDIDLLSIDIDGNDYYVWEAIKSINPRVVVIEYNAKFPANFEWIMEYDENHTWNGDDEMGASLKSLELLGHKKGYQLVGTNYTGSNAFFVKKELAKGKFCEPATSENLYNPPRYYLKYKSGHPSKKYIGK